MAPSGPTEASELLIREIEELRVRLAEAERKLAEAEHQHGEPESQSKDAQGSKQEALLESELRYRTLFESIDEGFCLLERVGDDAPDAPPDFRCLEVNPALTLQFGVSDVVGQTIGRNFGSEAKEWIAAFETICRTGEAIRFERKLDLNRRILELYAFRVGEASSGRVGVLFQDITRAQAGRRGTA